MLLETKKKFKMVEKNLKQKQQRKSVYLFKMRKNNFIDKKKKKHKLRFLDAKRKMETNCFVFFFVRVKSVIPQFCGVFLGR